MQQHHASGDGVGELEPDRHVKDHDQERQQQRDHGGIHEGFADQCAQGGLGLAFEFGLREGLVQGFGHGIHDLRAGVGGLRFRAAFLFADHDLEFLLGVQRAAGLVGDLVFKTGRGERLGDLLGRDRFLEGEGQLGAAGEVDAEAILAADSHADERGDDHGEGESQGEFLQAEEIDLRGLDHLQHAELVDGGEPGHQVEEQTGQEHGGEQRGEHTDRQGDGESLDRAGAFPEQDHRHDQRGDVRVENRGISTVETEVDRVLDRLAALHFFADTFINQHVGVHGHTDGQDDTGDTWQGQRDVERRHGAEDQDRVYEERDVRHDTAADVIDQHEQHDQDHAGDTGIKAVVDGLLADGRVDVGLRLNRHGERNAAADQRVGDVFRIFTRETAGDLGVAAGDRLLDLRRGIKFAVQDDGQFAADVVAGDFAETDRSGGLERKQDLALSELVHGRIRVVDLLAVHLGRAFHNVNHLDGLAVAGLVGDLQFIAFRSLIVLRIGHIFFDFIGIVRMHQLELQLGAHLDQPFEDLFLFLGHDRHAHGDVFAARGRDVGFEDVLLGQTFAKGFDRQVAVFVEILFDLGLVGGIGDEFEDEFGAAVEVDTAADGAGGVLPDQREHVARAGDLLGLDDDRFHHFFEGDALVGRRIFQRGGVIHGGIFGLLGLRRGDQFGDFLAVGIGADVLERVIEIPLAERIHGKDEYAQHQQSEDRTEDNRFLIHFLASSPAGTELTALFISSTLVLSAILTMKVCSLTVTTSP